MVRESMAKRIFSFFRVLGALGALLLFNACGTLDGRLSSEVTIDKVRNLNRDHFGGRKAVDSQNLQVDISGQQLLSIIPDGENLRVGLVLGPGVLRAFAHVGLLKAFEEEKIPVTAVVGLEWGGLVAAFYARKGEAFDVEWQMLKLKKNYLPSSELMSSKIKMTGAQSLSSYLDDVFSKSVVEESQLFFACPSRDLSKLSRVIWHDKGEYRQILKSCLSYPPYYRPHGNQVAGVFALKASVDKLKEAGVNRVFFINLLQENQPLDTFRKNLKFETQLLWQQGFELLNSQKSSVDEFLNINMQEFSLTNHDLRHEMIKRGYDSGKVFIEKIRKKYGF